MTSTLWRVCLIIRLLRDVMGGQVFGNFGMAASHKSASAVSQSNARVALAQGRAKRGQAYGHAARLELENEVAGEQAAENMSRLRKAQRQAGAAARVSRAASGFSTEGSGSQAEVSVLSRYEQAAADMVHARSLADVSARFKATMQRRAGDIALQGAAAEAEHDMFEARIARMKAHNAQQAAWVSLGAQAVGAVVGGIAGGWEGAMQGFKAGEGVGSIYGAALPGTVESQGGRNKQSEADFSAILSKGLEMWLGK